MACAVIDTNVLVSAAIPRNHNAAAVRVLKLVLDGTFTPAGTLFQ